MPRHDVSFKHLISAPASSSSTSQKKDKSVNDLLASSRKYKPVDRELDSLGQRVWTVDAGASGVGSSIGAGLIGPGENAIHPAELLRRYHLSRRQAGRTVAGPAPPPSWRTSTSTDADTSKTKQTSDSAAKSAASNVTIAELNSSEDLFSHTLSERQPSRNSRASQGAFRLVEHCLVAVLRHLEDRTPLHDQEPGDYASSGNHPMTYGDAFRQQIPYLEPHLKASLLLVSSLQPSSSSHLKLSDKSLRSLLVIPHDPDPGDISEMREGFNAEGESSSDDWAETPFADTSTTLRYLPLTSHTNPTSLLKHLPEFSALTLTSLNLAYSRIPDLERLVTVLPHGLRELGLAGVRFSETGEPRRGFGALGRKFLVLRMLDLSYLPTEINQLHLQALLHPPESRLPSLRVLGLRRHQESGTQQTLGLDEQKSQTFCGNADSSGFSVPNPDVALQRKSMTALVRGQGRKGYIDIIWD